jgi:hypothetical protein
VSPPARPHRAGPRPRRGTPPAICPTCPAISTASANRPRSHGARASIRC